ncbi:hypothetical protein ABH926_008933 [Catenulispora sp. GP43]|uniref:hypothetical protein n=1 Tax=Catenulispora sp. GP43 TaxID=3156263 RepID=UPI003513BA4A
MDLSETFYAAAAGVFPLLVVAVVVAIRFNLGETRKERARHEEVMKGMASFLEESPQKVQEITNRIVEMSQAGDRAAMEEALLEMRNRASFDQIVRTFQSLKMPESEKKITRRYGMQKAGALGMALLFGSGEAAAFLSLVLGTEKKWVRDFFGPVTVGTLFGLIVFSAAALVIQTVNVEHD